MIPKPKTNASHLRKKPTRSKLTNTPSNGFSAIGSRIEENEWLAKHPEKLRPFIGQYVVVHGRRIAAHNKDAAKAVQTARRLGVTVPYIFFVEPPASPNTFRIGL